MTHTVPFRILIFVFLIGFLFALLLLQNLPFTFGDDLDTMQIADQTSWSFLLRQTLNPTTPVWFALRGDINRLNTRVFDTILFKLLHRLFGLNPNAFWILQALSFAGVGTLIAILVFMATREKHLATMAAFFFYLLPPVFKSLSWMSDREVLAEFFILVSFSSFLSLYRPNRRADVNSTTRIILLVLSAWLGMKLKETVRMVPLILLAFLVLHQNRNLLRWLRENRIHVFLILYPLFLLLTVIPWKAALMPETETPLSKTNFQFSPSFLPLLLGYPAIHFTLPLLLLAVCLVLVFLTHQRESSHQKPPGFASEHLLFFGIWAVFCLLASSLGFDLKGQIRYFTTVLIPLTVFVFALLGNLVRVIRVRFPKFEKLVFVPVLMVSILFQTPLEAGRVKFHSKLDKILFMRNYLSGTDIADYQLTKRLYEDYLHISNASWTDLEHFYHGKPPADPALFGDLRIKEWDPDEDVSETRLEKRARRRGAVYVLSSDPTLSERAPGLSLLWQGTTENGSVYSRVIGKVKKKNSRKIFLYKYPGPSSQPAVHTSVTG